MLESNPRRRSNFDLFDAALVAAILTAGALVAALLTT
jgi:hypothetical protein